MTGSDYAWVIATGFTSGFLGGTVAMGVTAKLVVRHLRKIGLM